MAAKKKDVDTFTVTFAEPLAKELQIRGLLVEREKQLSVYYREEKVGTYIPDILVNKTIIIELKAKPFLHKDDIAQFWYYLKNAEFRLGFLVNFGEPGGVKIIRRVYGYEQARTGSV